MVVIEMNPRVSRSSALASKATGFPIAKIAAKLAVGYLLDEIRNDITRETPASFEPTIDYVVTKIPRFAFEKFPEADPTLTTQMKSVGEAMAIGRTFKESLQKALRGLETGRFGLGCDRSDRWGTPRPADAWTRSSAKLATPNAERIWYIRYAFKAGLSVDDIHQRTKIDPLVPATTSARSIEMEDRLAQPAPATARPGHREATPAAAGSEAERLLRPAAGQPVAHDGDRDAPASARPRHRPVVQAAWTPAPPSSRPTRRTITPPTKRRTRLECRCSWMARGRRLSSIPPALCTLEDETVPRRARTAS